MQLFLKNLVKHCTAVSMDISAVIYWEPISHSDDGHDGCHVHHPHEPQRRAAPKEKKGKKRAHRWSMQVGIRMEGKNIYS